MTQLIRMAGLVLALAVGAGLEAAEAQARRPQPGRFEVPGLDFRRDGAWRARTDAIRGRRREFLRSGSLSALNSGARGAAAGARVTGTYKLPVVLVRPNNVTPPFPVADYQTALFTPTPAAIGRPYSLRTYYEQVSNDYITLEGVVFDWFMASQTDAYYEDGCNGVIDDFGCDNGGLGSYRMGEMLVEALDAISNGANGATVWAQFDNDGPDGEPNSSDDDGVVDFVTFVHPEIDGACGGNPNIWAHRFVLRAVIGGSPYVTKTPTNSAAAGARGQQFIQLDDYTMQSGLGGNSACTVNELMPIGTIAHETGHAFGLPDLYDTDGVTEGIGEWGLMGSGNYARAHSPSRMEAWSLVELGWVDVDTLSTDRTVVLGPVSSTDTVLYAAVPGNSEEYLLFENRQALESDTAQMNPAFGSREKAPGLLVWHIDRRQINSTKGFENRINTGSLQGVALVQADGLNQLRTPGSGNRGDTGDSYPGATGNRTLSASSAPALVDNRGAFIGFALDSIAQVAPGGAVGFVFRPVETPSVAVTLQQATDAILGGPALSPGQVTLLDQTGNRNGRFDVGDFFAYIQITGQTPDPDVMRRVLARPGRGSR